MYKFPTKNTLARSHRNVHARDGHARVCCAHFSFASPSRVFVNSVVVVVVIAACLSNTRKISLRRRQSEETVVLLARRFLEVGARALCVTWEGFLDILISENG